MAVARHACCPPVKRPVVLYGLLSRQAPYHYTGKHKEKGQGERVCQTHWVRAQALLPTNATHGKITRRNVQYPRRAHNRLRTWEGGSARARPKGVTDGHAV